jgi:Zinc knuckle
VGYRCSRTESVRRNAVGFLRLYSALVAAYLQHQEELDARRNDRNAYRTTAPMPSVPGLNSVMYQGQGMYARPRAPGSKSSAPQGFHNNRPVSANHNGRTRRCYNCNSEKHTIRDCPEPRQMVKNIAERASRLDTIDDMKRILYEVATQAKDAIFADPDEDEQYKAFICYRQQRRSRRTSG